MMKKENTFAIIPAHNEEKNIAKVLSKVKKYVDYIVVVDDGSSDNTSKIAKEAGCIVLRHLVNLGKGAALKTGCDFAINNEAKMLIVLDADAQHDPSDIPRFIEKLQKYEIVFSFRKKSSKMPFVLRFGNWFISEVVNLLYGVSLKDTQSGYRAFTSGTYKKIRWSASDYSMESEMISRTGKQKLKYVQIPIQTIYSDRYKGTTVLDGMKIVFNMLIWRIIKRNGA
jgi:glycosyltransferase involved in cell wall biosynthesis